ncbi:hypothetical protein [Faecalibacterium prausnitzii]|uniref:hypothetical protein n=1 Tax=Faecalibacterium prausnitzii TaxID=853 RepID=UPI0018CC6738|nr:hypothetical protein [Faecalibacterium prausnitzii]
MDRLADHQAIQRNHDQEEPNRNTKIPQKPSDPVSNKQSLTHLQKLTPSNDDFYGTVGCTCKAFMEPVHVAQLLPPQFRSIFLIILPQKDFFLNIFIDL